MKYFGPNMKPDPITVKPKLEKMESLPCGLFVAASYRTYKSYIFPLHLAAMAKQRALAIG